MAADRPEVVLTVPADLTRRCKGLALDLGSSSLKFVYRTKEDLDEATSADSKLGRLRLLIVSRSELNEGLDYVRQRAHLFAAGDEPLTLSATGVGSMSYGKVIRAALNVSIKNATEFDCFVKSFHYLASRMPRHQFLEPFELDAIQEPIEYVSSQVSVIAGAQGKNLSQGVDFDLAAAMVNNIRSSTGRPLADDVQPPVETPLSESEPDMYPCVLAMCGSGFGFMKVEKDGSFKMLDGSMRGGKGFVGVGTLLTGSKNFDELMELASKGNPRNVDQYTDDLNLMENAVENEESFYALATQAKPGLVFTFGKAASEHGNFNREDLAAAWLNYVVLDLTQLLHYICEVNGAKRAFFCGGFTAHPVVRQAITRELARRNMFISLFQQQSRLVTFDFVKAGQHLGALGCLVNDLEVCEEKCPEQDTQL